MVGNDRIFWNCVFMDVLLNTIVAMMALYVRISLLILILR